MAVNTNFSLSVFGLSLDIVRVVSSTTGKIWGSYQDETGIPQRPCLQQSWQWLVESLYIIKSTTDLAASGRQIDDQCNEAVMSANGQSDQQLWVNLNNLRNQFSALLFKREVLADSNVGGLFLRCMNRRFFATAGSKYRIGPSDMPKRRLGVRVPWSGSSFCLAKG